MSPRLGKPAFGALRGVPAASAMRLPPAETTLRNLKISGGVGQGASFELPGQIAPAPVGNVEHHRFGDQPAAVAPGATRSSTRLQAFAPATNHFMASEAISG